MANDGGKLARANLHRTRSAINNAASSAQARAFRGRHATKLKLEAQARKVAAARAQSAKSAPDEAEPTSPPDLASEE